MAEDRRCKNCLNLIKEPGDPRPFCRWLGAYLEPSVTDDLSCEGFMVKSLRTSKTKTPTYGKTQALILAALKFKRFKGGSVVMEKVCCGKPGCRCQSGSLHGPYPYLHFYSEGKVKRRYLSKPVSALLAHSEEELERMLHETEAGLGQEGTVKERL